jgi:replicative DNA helicase
VLAQDPPDQVTLGVLGEFIQREGLRAISMQIAQQIDGGKLNLEEIQRDIQKLCLTVEDDRERAQDYGTADRIYINRLLQGRVTTGIPGLDSALRGGLGPGELGIGIAPPYGGKTAFLVNLGAAAVEQGKRVLHISLEIHKDMILLRYDMRLGGMTFEEIQSDKHGKKIGKLRSRVSKTGGRLSYLDVSHEELPPRRVEALVRSLLPIDLLLVDYADLMVSDRAEEGRRFELGYVYKQLRRVASALQIPVWTCSQGTREALKKGIFSMADIAEDITKVHTGDVVVCLLQSEEQKRAQQMILSVEKARISGNNSKINIITDYPRMTFREAEGVQMEALQEVIK